MKDYDKNKESSYLMYWNVNNWHVSLGGFKLVEETSEFNEDFIKSYKEDSDIGYFFEVFVQYLEEMLGLHHDLPSLSEKKIGKFENLLAKFYDKKEYIIHIRI